MSQKISVLIIDDSSLARQGWRNILKEAKDITIIGELPTIDLAIQPQSTLQSDVILIGIKSLPIQDSEKLIQTFKGKSPRTKIIMSVNTFEEILKAHELGVHEAFIVPIEGHKLLSLIRGLYQENKRLCEFYAEQLLAISSGIKDATRFEKLMGEIIQTLFHPHLTHAREQSSTARKTQRRDLVLYNGSDHPFWRGLRERHRATQVVFEFKNTSRWENNYLDQLAGYLGRSLGDFGFLVIRKPVGKGILKKQIEVFNQQDKVVLVLKDDDIRSMLAYKAAGVDPTDTIVNLYLSLQQSIQ